MWQYASVLPSTWKRGKPKALRALLSMYINGKPKAGRACGILSTTVRNRAGFKDNKYHTDKSDTKLNWGAGVEVDSKVSFRQRQEQLKQFNLSQHILWLTELDFSSCMNYCCAHFPISFCSVPPPKARNHLPHYDTVRLDCVISGYFSHQMIRISMKKQNNMRMCHERAVINGLM